ncbi:MAG: aminoglycoside phosphotransferase family protein [Deltaproteobacteria bacterium]|nr:aminoglycoside phosphotransferase family protein [Deltaproteobacteria bacterium]
MTDARVFPLIEVAPEQLAKLAGGPLTKIERVEGGLTNTIHKVIRDNGDILTVKHYAGGKDAFEAELATLTLLHGTLPVPDVVHADEALPAIVYRWIDGTTFNDLRRKEPPAAFLSLAEPIGRLLAWLARTDATEPFELAPVLERAYAQLTSGRAFERLGAPLSEALRRGLEAAEPRLAWGNVCLVHGDFSGRNLIVQRAEKDRWRINGLIDWEATTTFSPLLDLGSMFRYADRYDADFRALFERGYREADGQLPEDWMRTARLLDATLLIDTLDDVNESPGVYADCRLLLAKLVAELQ